MVRALVMFRPSLAQKPRLWLGSGGLRPCENLGRAKAATGGLAPAWLGPSRGFLVQTSFRAVGGLREVETERRNDQASAWCPSLSGTSTSSLDAKSSVDPWRWTHTTADAEPWEMLMFDVHHYRHPCHLNEVKYYKCHDDKRHELSYQF